MANNAHSFVGLQIDRQGREALRRLGGSVARGRAMLMKEIAAYWHSEIFPAHFTPGAESRYGYTPRTDAYRSGKKLRYGRGQGKYVSNLFTGESRRRMMHFKTISGTSKTSTIKMESPAYFRKPFVGTFTRPDGSQATIRRQPDKVDEVTRVNAADLQKIRTFASTRLQELINGTTTARAA